MKSHEINKQNNESVKLCQKAQFNLDFNCLICLSSTVAKKASFILKRNNICKKKIIQKIL